MASRWQSSLPAGLKMLSPAQIATRLGPEDRWLSEQLAVFSGGWELEGAEFVCTDETSPTRDVLNGLDGLVSRSLVQAEQGRYRLLEPVHEYANLRLWRSAAVGGLHHRHAHYHLHLAETADPELKRVEQAVWFERLAMEHDNFRAALRWSLAEERLGSGSVWQPLCSASGRHVATGARRGAALVSRSPCQP
jgi:predicted ATPase